MQASSFNGPDDSMQGRQLPTNDIHGYDTSLAPHIP